MKMLVQLFLLHNFLHNHMHYIYRQIYNLKEKKFCLNKISFFFFFFYTNCSSTSSVSSCSRCINYLHWVWIRKILLNRSCQIWFIPCYTLCLEHQANLGVITDSDALVFCSTVFFIHLHHLHLPLHQTGMYKAGSAGSGQAIFLPSV